MSDKHICTICGREESYPGSHRSSTAGCPYISPTINRFGFPEGTYRVIDGELFKMESGVPPMGVAEIARLADELERALKENARLQSEIIRVEGEIAKMEKGRP